MATAASLGKLVIELVGDISDFTGKMETAQSKMQNVASNMAKAGVGLTAGVTAPILGLGAAVLAVGSQYDDAMDTIAVATGATGDELAGLGDVVRDVFTSIPTSMDIAATAVGELAARSDATGEALSNLAAAEIELARITGGDLSSQIASTTRLFGDWGVEVENQVPALDSLLRASQNSGIEVDTLAQRLVQFGAPLRQMGFGLDESTALLAKFEQEGVNTELVLGSMRIALGKFAKAGIEPVEGLRMMITEIQNAGSTADANALAMEVFGARAGPDMAAAIREGRFSIDEMMAAIANGEGTIMGTAEATADYGEKLALLKNKVMEAAIPLGVTLFEAINNLMPAIETGIGFIAKLVEGFGKLPKGVQGGILAFLAILAAVGPLLVGLSGIITVVSSVGGALAGLGGVVSAAVAAIGAALGPILLIIAAVGLAVLAFKAAWESNFLGIRDIAEAVWTAIQSIFGQIQRIVEGVMAFLRGEISFDDLRLTVEDAFILMGDAINEAWERIKQIVAGAWTAIKGVIIDGLAGFIAPLVGGMENARQIIATAWESVTTFLANTWETIKTAAAGAWEFLKGVVAGAVEFIRGIIAGAMQILSGDWTGAWETIKETVTRVWDQIKSGISNALDAIGPAVATAWDNIKAGVTEKVEAIKTVVAERWEAIKGGAIEKWEAIKERISTIVTGIKDFVIDTIGGLVDKAIELFGRLIGALTGGGGGQGGGGSPLAIDFSALIASLLNLRENWTLTLTHVTNTVTQMQALIVAAWTAISAATTAAWTAIQTGLVAIWTLLLTAYTAHGQAMLLQTQMTNTAIYETTTATWYMLRDELLMIWEEIKGRHLEASLHMLANTRQINQWILQEHQKTWPMIVSVVVTNAQQMRDQAVAIVQGMASSITAALDSMAASARHSGEALGAAFAAGIRSQQGAVAAAAAALAAAARAYLPSSDAKKGPLSDLSRTGPALVGMIVDGINKTKPKLEGTMADVASLMRPAMRPYELAPATLPPYATRPATPTRPAAPPTVNGQGGSAAGGVQKDKPCITINIYNPVGQPAEKDIMRALKQLSALGVMEEV